MGGGGVGWGAPGLLFVGWARCCLPLASVFCDAGRVLRGKRRSAADELICLHVDRGRAIPHGMTLPASGTEGIA